MLMVTFCVKKKHWDFNYKYVVAKILYYVLILNVPVSFYFFCMFGKIYILEHITYSFLFICVVGIVSMERKL